MFVLPMLGLEVSWTSVLGILFVVYVLLPAIGNAIRSLLWAMACALARVVWRAANDKRAGRPE